MVKPMFVHIIYFFIFVVFFIGNGSYDFECNLSVFYVFLNCTRNHTCLLLVNNTKNCSKVTSASIDCDRSSDLRQNFNICSVYFHISKLHGQNTKTVFKTEKIQTNYLQLEKWHCISIKLPSN